MMTKTEKMFYVYLIFNASSLALTHFYELLGICIWGIVQFTVIGFILSKEYARKKRGGKE
jgi:hypothetical protein